VTNPRDPSGISLKWGNISLAVAGLWGLVVLAVLAVAAAFLWLSNRYLDEVKIEHTAIIEAVKRLEGAHNFENQLRLSNCPVKKYMEE